MSATLQNVEPTITMEVVTQICFASQQPRRSRCSRTMAPRHRAFNQHRSETWRESPYKPHKSATTPSSSSRIFSSENCTVITITLAPTTPL